MRVEFSNDTYKQVLEDIIPFHKFLGLKVVKIEEGYLKIRIPFNKILIGDPRIERWHGGVMATILDAAVGGAALTYLKHPHDKISTMDMRIDYLKGGKPKDIVAEGWVIRKGTHTFHVKMKAYHQDDSEVTLAEGTAVMDIRLSNP